MKKVTTSTGTIYVKLNPLTAKPWQSASKLFYISLGYGKNENNEPNEAVVGPFNTIEECENVIEQLTK